MNAKSVDPKLKTWVVRFSTHWRFMKTEWDGLLRSPGKGGARQWAQQCGAGRKPGCLMDTWGWQEHGARITGLMRINNQDAVKTLIAKSGTYRQGQTWFAELVTRDTDICKHNVLWQDWHEGENWWAYLERVQNATSNGVILGNKQLGRRVTEDDARWKPPTCSWNLTGFPRDLNYDSVVDLLEDLEFQEVNVTGRAGRGSTVIWFFKAHYARTKETCSR